MTTKADQSAPSRIIDALHRQQFLSEASRILAESIDNEATLRSVARLAVPAMADWCVVDLVQDDGSIVRVAIEHWDESRRVPPTFISAAESDPLRRISTPLLARDRLLGTLTLVVDAGRTFDSADVEMTEDLARRCAMAIDNARLFEEAQRAVQSRDELLAIVSHDLRTPLSAIMMASTLQIATASDSEDGQRIRQRAEVCQRAAEHMRRLITDLEDIGHIEAGRLTIERGPEDPASLVREVAETLHGLTIAQGSELHVDLDGELPPIECDRDRIVQVLSNLITNAVKAGAASITVSARWDAGTVVFSVRDTGPGISSEDLPRLFDRYWRGSGANYKGTGLGLPIAKGIIDAHGGCFSVSSEVGVGTTFSFALPCLF